MQARVCKFSMAMPHHLVNLKSLDQWKVLDDGHSQTEVHMLFTTPLFSDCHPCHP